MSQLDIKADHHPLSLQEVEFTEGQIGCTPADPAPGYQNEHNPPKHPTAAGQTSHMHQLTPSDMRQYSAASGAVRQQWLLTMDNAEPQVLAAY